MNFFLHEEELQDRHLIISDQIFTEHLHLTVTCEIRLMLTLLLTIHCTYITERNGTCQIESKHIEHHSRREDIAPPKIVETDCFTCIFVVGIPSFVHHQPKKELN